MAENTFSVGVDVGGTFTDCLGLGTNGQELRHKVLSNGVTKGVTTSECTRDCIVDPMRCHDPDDFWRGFLLRLFNADGQIVSQVKVGNSLRRDGCLRLASPLPETP